MKRPITKPIINALMNLKYSLNPRLFKSNLEAQIKSSYEINLEFLNTFYNDLDSDFISQCSLTPDCINFLIENDKFDYNAWSSDLNHKNIDILADDQFVKKYSVDLDSILSTVKNISPTIFKKYVNYNNKTVKRNMLLNYSGPELTVGLIMNNFDILKEDIFKIQKIIDELRLNNSMIQDKILNAKLPISPVILLYLMQLVYIPKEVDDALDNLEFETLDLGEDNPKANELINTIQNMLSNIFEKYPVTVINKLMQELFYSASEALLNHNLLTKLLIEFDNLDEQMLVLIHNVFTKTNTLEELKTYSRNHDFALLSPLLSI